MFKKRDKKEKRKLDKTVKKHKHHAEEVNSDEEIDSDNENLNELPEVHTDEDQLRKDESSSDAEQVQEKVKAKSSSIIVESSTENAAKKDSESYFSEVKFSDMPLFEQT